MTYYLIITKLFRKIFLLIFFFFVLLNLSLMTGIYSMEESIGRYQMDTIYSNEISNPMVRSIEIDGNWIKDELTRPSDYYHLMSAVESKVNTDILWMTSWFFPDELTYVRYPNASLVISTIILPDSEFTAMFPDESNPVLLNPGPRNANASSIDLNFVSSPVSGGAENFTVNIPVTIHNSTLPGLFSSNDDYYIPNHYEVLLIPNSSPLVSRIHVGAFTLILKIDIEKFSPVERIRPHSLAKRLVQPIENLILSSGYLVSTFYSVNFDSSADTGILIILQFILFAIFFILFSPIFIALYFSFTLMWFLFSSSLDKNIGVFLKRGFRKSKLRLTLFVNALSVWFLSSVISVLCMSLLSNRQYSELLGRDSIYISLSISFVYLCTFVYRLIVLNIKFPQDIPVQKERRALGILFSISLVTLVTSFVLIQFLPTEYLALAAVLGVSSMGFLISGAVVAITDSFIPFLFKYLRTSKHKILFLSVGRIKLDRRLTRNISSTSFLIFLLLFFFIVSPATIQVGISRELVYSTGGYVTLSSPEPLSPENESYIRQELGSDYKMITTAKLWSTSFEFLQQPVTIFSYNCTELKMMQDIFPLEFTEQASGVWDDGSPVSFVTDDVLKDPSEPLASNKISLDLRWFSPNTSLTFDLDVLGLISEAPGSYQSLDGLKGGWSVIVSEGTFDNIMSYLSDISSISYRYTFLNQDVIEKKDVIEDIVDRFPGLTVEYAIFDASLPGFFNLDVLLTGLVESASFMVVVYYSLLTTRSLIESNRRMKYYTILKLSRSDISIISLLTFFGPTILSLLLAYIFSSFSNYLLLILFSLVALRPAVLNEMRHYPLFHVEDLLTLLLILFAYSVFLVLVYYLNKQKLTFSREKDY